MTSRNRAVTACSSWWICQSLKVGIKGEDLVKSWSIRRSSRHKTAYDLALALHSRAVCLNCYIQHSFLLYRQSQRKIRESSNVISHLKHVVGSSARCDYAGGQESLTDSQAVVAMDSCSQMLTARYDDRLGGFGNAPKFPRPSELNLLLVQHLRKQAAGSQVEASETPEPSFTLVLKVACSLHLAEGDVKQESVTFPTTGRDCGGKSL